MYAVPTHLCHRVHGKLLFNIGKVRWIPPQIQLSHLLNEDNAVDITDMLNRHFSQVNCGISLIDFS